MEERDFWEENNGGEERETKDWGHTIHTGAGGERERHKIKINKNKNQRVLNCYGVILYGFSVCCTWINHQQFLKNLKYTLFFRVRNRLLQIEQKQNSKR